MNKYILGIILIGLLIGSAFYFSSKNTTILNTNQTEQSVVTSITTSKTDIATTTSKPITKPVPKTPTPTPVPTIKSYTLAEIKVHSDANSCWTTVENKVYDITSFISKHPGGEGNVLRICGIDGTALFEGQHGGDARPSQILATYFIGNLTQ